MDNLRSAEIFVKVSYGDIMFFKRVNGKSQFKVESNEKEINGFVCNDGVCSLCACRKRFN